MSGMELGAGECPRCGSGDLEYGAVELDGMSLYYPVTCKGCGFGGKEWYDLNFTGYTDEDNNDIVKEGGD